MTILRRNLLAGTAVLFAASVSGCDGKQKPLRTKFMADFTAAFIGDPAKIKNPAPPPGKDPWPDPTRLWPVCALKPTMTDIVADYATFLNVLLTVGYVGAPPPNFTSGSLGDRIGKFLVAQNWPAGTAVPSEYQDERPTVHLVEIAVIQERLLQAINSYNLTDCKGAGGFGSNWPPH